MLTLTVQAQLGGSIENTFIQSIELATKLNLCVEFDFNGITCWAFPNSSPFKGVEAYNNAGKTKSKYASSK